MDTFANGRVSNATEAAAPDTTPNLETPQIDEGEVARELAVRPYRVFFGELEETDKPKLDYLIRQLNPNSKLQPDEVIGKIRSIEAKLGASQEKRIDRVYRYIKLVNTNRELLLEAL